jgi:hypothetical protein
MGSNPETTDGTDAFFGFLAGLYVAALVAPAVTMAVARRVTSDPAVLYLTLLGTATVVVAVVGLVARRESLAIRIGASRWKWAAVVVPFGYLAGLFAGAVTDSDPAAAVGWVTFPGAIAGMLVGFGLVVAARNRYSKAVLAAAEEYASWSARSPERDRQLAKAGAVAAFALGISGFFASMVFDYAPFRWMANLLVPMAAGVVGATDERTLTVTDDGVAAKRALNRSVRPWSVYESYSVSETALVVHRAGWSAWGVRDVRCDLGDVADVDAAETALSKFLPRREG